jgi:hypothetical protein
MALPPLDILNAGQHFVARQTCLAASDNHVSVVELKAAANECRIPRSVLPLNPKTMSLAAEALDRWAEEIECQRSTETKTVGARLVELAQALRGKL